MTLDLAATFGTGTPLIGMVHLPPLPGAPGYGNREDGVPGREAIRKRAVADAEALAAGGIDGVLVENFGDSPFYPDDVPDHVVAEMTAVVGAVREAVEVPVGVNVLRNDAAAALSVAAATGGAFVRVNVHSGAAVTDQGVIEGRAHETVRLRERIDSDAAILADAGVKHASSLGGRGVETEARELATRGHADGVVVSGAATGDTPPVERIERVQDAIGDLDDSPPVVVGSGLTAESAPELLGAADGAIVGTALKEGGETTNPVDPDRVREVVAAADEVR